MTLEALTRREFKHRNCRVHNETTGENFLVIFSGQSVARVLPEALIRPGDIIRDPADNKRYVIAEISKVAWEQHANIHHFWLTAEIIRPAGAPADAFGRQVGAPVTVASNVPVVFGKTTVALVSYQDLRQGDSLVVTKGVGEHVGAYVVLAVSRSSGLLPRAELSEQC
jgi:hypothetical protein